MSNPDFLSGIKYIAFSSYGTIDCPIAGKPIDIGDAKITFNSGVAYTFFDTDSDLMNKLVFAKNQNDFFLKNISDEYASERIDA